MADDLRAKLEELRAFFDETSRNLDQLSKEQRELLASVLKRIEEERTQEIRKTIQS